MSLYTQEQLSLKLSASHQIMTNFGYNMEKALKNGLELAKNYAADLKNAQEKIKELRETYEKQIEELTEKNEEQATTILVLRQALNQRPQHEMTEKINLINSAVESGQIDENGEIVEDGYNSDESTQAIDENGEIVEDGCKSVDSDGDWDHSVLDSDSDDDNADDNQVENSKDDEPTVIEDAKRITHSICKKGMDYKEIDQIPDKEKMVITFKGNVHETKWVFRRLGLGGRFHPTSVQYEYIQQITTDPRKLEKQERFGTSWMQRKERVSCWDYSKKSDFEFMALEYYGPIDHEKYLRWDMPKNCFYVYLDSNRGNHPWQKNSHKKYNCSLDPNTLKFMKARRCISDHQRMYGEFTEEDVMPTI